MYIVVFQLLTQLTNKGSATCSSTSVIMLSVIVCFSLSDSVVREIKTVVYSVILLHTKIDVLNQTFLIVCV